MPLHPLRWMSGGSLFGRDVPPRCITCGLFISPDSPDPWCPPCKVLALAAREDARRKAEQEAAEQEADPLHVDGRGAR